MTVSESDDSLLVRLKRDTEGLHRALERDFPASPDVPSLAETLRRFHSFFSVWEPAAEQAVTPHIPGYFESRRKLPLIDRDLAVLGCPHDNIGSTLKDAALLTSWPSVLGAMYVVEGSTLGGRIIARSIERDLGLSGGRGYSYFVAYGEETGSRWREFGAIMGRHQRRSASDRIVAGAKATFEQLRWTLCR